MIATLELLTGSKNFLVRGDLYFHYTDKQFSGFFTIPFDLSVEFEFKQKGIYPTSYSRCDQLIFDKIHTFYCTASMDTQPVITIECDGRVMKNHVLVYKFVNTKYHFNVNK